MSNLGPKKLVRSFVQGHPAGVCSRGQKTGLRGHGGCSFPVILHLTHIPVFCGSKRFWHPLRLPKPDTSPFPRVKSQCPLLPVHPSTAPSHSLE